MIRNCLSTFQTRLGAITWRWCHLLPILGYYPVLAALVAGMGICNPDARFLSSVWPSAIDQNEVEMSFSSAHQQNQHIDGDGDLFRDQEPPSLKANKALYSVLKESRPLAGGAVATALPMPSRMPGKLVGFDNEERKKVFIDLLLPTITVALDEVRQERQQLLAIIAELGLEPDDLFFSDDQSGWQGLLGGDKSKFIRGLTQKYRTENAAELVAMVNVLPPSLVIAQGALESAWGASRFAVEVNNLFGMYASVDGRLSKSSSSKGPRIMEYDSILESVRAYVLNINRLSAYKELRRIRCQTLDPMLIADGLTQYSERKKYYIEDLKNIIARNKLQDYDAIIAESV